MGMLIIFSYLAIADLHISREKPPCWKSGRIMESLSLLASGAARMEPVAGIDLGWCKVTCNEDIFSCFAQTTLCTHNKL
jgi:hypothetical protein